MKPWVWKLKKYQRKLQWKLGKHQAKPYGDIKAIVGGIIIGIVLIIAYGRFNIKPSPKNNHNTGSELSPDSYITTRHPTLTDGHTLLRIGEEQTKRVSILRCNIKGNISLKGDRIFHVPSGKHYSETNIDISKGEKWFCSEAEAISAGWRKSKR